MSKSLTSKIVEYIFIILSITGTVCLLLIPNLYNLLKDENVVEFFKHNIFYTTAFYICYIVSLAIIYNLYYMFRLINKGNPFLKNVEVSLKVNASLFMILFIIVFIKTIFIRTLLSIVVFGICFIISLCFYVLSQIIKSAINYKEEVDSTI